MHPYYYKTARIGWFTISLVRAPPGARGIDAPCSSGSVRTSAVPNESALISASGGLVPDVQLFDVEVDLRGQTNVVDDRPDIVSDLVETMAVRAQEYVSREENALQAVAREGPNGLNWAAEDRGEDSVSLHTQ